MTRAITNVPRERMGIYKRFDEVPDRYRLSHHAAAYENRDVWSEFIEESLFTRVKAETTRKDVRRVERRWKEHMDEEGRHHALATPKNVEVWCEDLLDRYQTDWAWNHVLRVEQFYDWLMWHTEHPHIYHPVLMAAVEYSGGATSRLWEHKVSLKNRGESG